MMVMTNRFTATLLIAALASCSDGSPMGVTNQSPTATIAAPGQGSSFEQGRRSASRGRGWTREGLLTGTSLVWTSDLEGEIGTGLKRPPPPRRFTDRSPSRRFSGGHLPRTPPFSRERGAGSREQVPRSPPNCSPLPGWGGVAGKSVFPKL